MADQEANELRQLLEQDMRELALLLVGIGDAAAGQRPQPDAWSVKEVLAHLSESARVRFAGLGELLRDPRYLLAPLAVAEVPEKLHAIVTTCGNMAALVSRCRGDFEDLANLVALLPPERLMMTARQRDGAQPAEVTVLPWVRAVFAEEFKEHLERIRAIRDGVKNA